MLELQDLPQLVIHPQHEAVLEIRSRRHGRAFFRLPADSSVVVAGGWSAQDGESPVGGCEDPAGPSDTTTVSSIRTPASGQVDPGSTVTTAPLEVYPSPSNPPTGFVDLCSPTRGQAVHEVRPVAAGVDDRPRGGIDSGQFRTRPRGLAPTAAAALTRS